MTPKEKAFELITKFQHPMSEMSDTDCLHIAVAKEFSLIAVDEILQSNPIIFREDNSIMLNKSYWQEVKKEIEKL
jgi:hypothetical protein